MAARFLIDEAAARNAVGTNSEALLSRRMLRTGLGLVRISCDDYFREAGHAQRGINLTRGFIATSSSILTSVLASEGASTEVIEYLGLATTGTYAYIDTYTEQFLFSAENIASVRSLTMDALSVHSGAIDISLVDTYDEASAVIVDHQALCQPQYIARLVREAIGAGRVVARGGDSQAYVDRSADRAVYRRIAEALDVPAINRDQAGALWWLINEDPSDAALEGPLRSALEDIDDGPYAGGEFNPAWSSRDEVARLLEALSSETKRDFAIRAGDLEAALIIDDQPDESAPTFATERSPTNIDITVQGARSD